MFGQVAAAFGSSLPFSPYALRSRYRSGSWQATRSAEGRAMKKNILVVAMAATTFLGLHTQAGAVFLGTADTFAVLAGSTVTNTGPTVVSGDLGVSPGSAITGFPPGLVTNGTIHAGDAAAAQAQVDLTTAYNALVGEAPTQSLTGQDLGGLTLTPGVYFFASSAALTGTVTLDAQGDPNARFDFQIGSTLITATNSSVHIIHGGDDCNVFWQVGSSATLGTGTAFAGHILALTSITLDTGATILDGSALARNGAVTMDSNTISTCRTTTAVPEPASTLLCGAGLALAAWRRRRR